MEGSSGKGRRRGGESPAQSMAELFLQNVPPGDLHSADKWALSIYNAVHLACRFTPTNVPLVYTAAKIEQTCTQPVTVLCSDAGNATSRSTRVGLRPYHLEEVPLGV